MGRIRQIGEIMGLALLFDLRKFRHSVISYCLERLDILDKHF